MSIDDVQFRWFGHWLKGVDNGVDKDPAVKIFVMGANKWRTQTVPPTRAAA